MAKLRLTEAAFEGIKGATKGKPMMNEQYKILVEQADKRIEANHAYYAKTYKQASTYLAR